MGTILGGPSAISATTGSAALTSAARRLDNRTGSDGKEEGDMSPSFRQPSPARRDLGPCGWVCMERVTLYRSETYSLLQAEELACLSRRIGLE